MEEPKKPCQNRKKDVQKAKIPLDIASHKLYYVN